MSTTLSAQLASEGELIEVRSNPPLSLDDAQSAWFIEEGEVDVFVAQTRSDGSIVARGLIGASRVGDILLGGSIAVQGDAIALRAVGLPHARLRRVTLGALRKIAAAPDLIIELAATLERWLIGVGACIARRVPAGKVVLLEPGHVIGVEPGRLGLARGTAVWVNSEEGTCSFLGSTTVSLRPELGRVPITKDIWIEPKEKIRISCADTTSSLQSDAGWAGLQEFQRLSLQLWVEKSKAEQDAEFQRLRDKAESENHVVHQAMQDLTDVMTEPESRSTHRETDPLLAAFRLVARALDVEVVVPSDRAGHASMNPLGDLARSARLRMRNVALRGEWWNHASGSMIGFTQNENHPIALLPRRGGGFDAVDPLAGSRVRVSAKNAAELPYFAFCFYRPLPDHALGALDLAKAGLRECRKDVRGLILFALGGSILGTVIPIATAKIINDTIPGADRTELFQIGIGLAAAILSTTIFNFSSTVAVLRMEGKMEAAVQSGLWDRLLNLPVPFFRQFSSGDLADRAMGINQIRKMLTDSAITSLLTAVFSVFSVALLFVYSVKLAMVAVGLVLLMSVTTAIVSFVQIGYQRQLYGLSGKLDGLVFQILTGISKLRIAKAEGRAFAVWARIFGKQNSLKLQSRAVAVFLETFNAAFSILATVAVFMGFAILTKGLLPTGSFLAFNAAFGSFLAAGLALSHSLISLLQVVPLYERAKPILETLPEVSLAKADPGILNGEIELNRVSFRYSSDGPPILQDISFRIAPTEFVALVGPSGSGKSTLFRLMFGFEKPESGSVSYDRQDLATLDVQAVRRQLGVVLQQGRLLSGDIFHNIVGALPLTMDDAWDAARKAGLAEDIEAMPMGMFTFISEGGGNLSGGQRQRLLIARALAAKPKILFFDEATSALDNRTQSIVSRSLEEMQVTRVVIAHRLSTIRNAHRIVVVEAGKLVETGSFEELMALRGAFHKLASRQLVAS